MINVNQFHHIGVKDQEQYQKQKILQNESGPEQVPLISFTKEVLDEDKE